MDQCRRTQVLTHVTQTVPLRSYLVVILRICEQKLQGPHSVQVAITQSHHIDLVIIHLTRAYSISVAKGDDIKRELSRTQSNDLVEIIVRVSVIEPIQVATTLNPR
jgi:hypothetical protein